MNPIIRSVYETFLSGYYLDLNVKNEIRWRWKDGRHRVLGEYEKFDAFFLRYSTLEAKRLMLECNNE
jgi:hypothetical protein